MMQQFCLLCAEFVCVQNFDGIKASQAKLAHSAYLKSMRSRVTTTPFLAAVPPSAPPGVWPYPREKGKAFSVISRILYDFSHLKPRRLLKKPKKVKNGLNIM